MTVQKHKRKQSTLIWILTNRNMSKLIQFPFFAFFLNLIFINIIIIIFLLNTIFLTQGHRIFIIWLMKQPMNPRISLRKYIGQNVGFKKNVSL